MIIIILLLILLISGIVYYWISYASKSPTFPLWGTKFSERAWYVCYKNHNHNCGRNSVHFTWADNASGILPPSCDWFKGLCTLVCVRVSHLVNVLWIICFLLRYFNWETKLWGGETTARPSGLAKMSAIKSNKHKSVLNNTYTCVRSIYSIFCVPLFCLCG